MLSEHVGSAVHALVCFSLFCGPDCMYGSSETETPVRTISAVLYSS